MNKYSDADIESKPCPACGGTKRALRGKYQGQTCPSCEGSGKRYPRRRDVLAQAFAGGGLPEQSTPPKRRWCKECRPGGIFREGANGKRLHLKCTACGGTTIVTVE